jgi:hypothetical protein
MAAPVVDRHSAAVRGHRFGDDDQPQSGTSAAAGAVGVPTHGDFGFGTVSVPRKSGAEAFSAGSQRHAFTLTLTC